MNIHILKLDEYNRYTAFMVYLSHYIWFEYWHMYNVDYLLLTSRDARLLQSLNVLEASQCNYSLKKVSQHDFK